MNAALNIEDVDYINAHGTSTQVNDDIETKAIKSVTCIMALGANVIPPTINLDTPDPECDLDYVPHHAREQELNVAMSNSFAFGGQNSVLIFKKFVA